MEHVYQVRNEWIAGLTPDVWHFVSATAHTKSREDIFSETSSLVCANPSTGACREKGCNSQNNRRGKKKKTSGAFVEARKARCARQWVADDECCAPAGNGGCAPNYTFAGQFDLSQTATTDVDGFNRGMDAACFEANTCCVPDGEMNFFFSLSLIFFSLIFF